MLTIESKPADAIKAAEYIKKYATEEIEVTVTPRSKNTDEKVVTVKKERATIRFYDVEDGIVDICITPFNYLIVTSYGFQTGIDI